MGIKVGGGGDELDPFCHASVLSIEAIVASTSRE
jgi:hypothetical protein